MKNLICISTGCLYRISNDKNERLKIIRKFNPQGVELCFADPKYLLSFEISPENLYYLKSLEYVSIHSPGKIKYGKNVQSGEVLQKIEGLYNQVGAKNVVFHKECVDDLDEITNYYFTASIENNDCSKKEAKTVEEIEEILGSHPKLKFIFDFAHALSVDSAAIPVFIEKFRDKLIQSHVSILKPDHKFLHEYDSHEIRDLLKQLDASGVPLILEGAASGPDDIDSLKDEINYLRTI